MELTDGTNLVEPRKSKLLDHFHLLEGTIAITILNARIGRDLELMLFKPFISYGEMEAQSSQATDPKKSENRGLARTITRVSEVGPESWIRLSSEVGTMCRGSSEVGMHTG